VPADNTEAAWQVCQVGRRCRREPEDRRMPYYEGWSFTLLGLSLAEHTAGLRGRPRPADVHQSVPQNAAIWTRSTAASKSPESGYVLTTRTIWRDASFRFQATVTVP
jgi:hypothetical protein